MHWTTSPSIDMPPLNGGKRQSMIPRLLLTINLAGSAVLGAQTAGPDGLTGGRALIITRATIVDTRGRPQ